MDSSDELRECLKWILKLQIDLPKVESALSGQFNKFRCEVVKLRSECIRLLAHTYELDTVFYNTVLRKTPQIFQGAFKALGKDLKNLHQAFKCRDILGDDMLVETLQPINVGLALEMFNTYVKEWRENLLLYNSKELMSLPRSTFCLSKAIECYIKTTLDVSMLVPDPDEKAKAIIAGLARGLERNETKAVNTTGDAEVAQQEPKVIFYCCGGCPISKHGSASIEHRKTDLKQ